MDIVSAILICVGFFWIAWISIENMCGGNFGDSKQTYRKKYYHDEFNLEISGWNAKN